MESRKINFSRSEPLFDTWFKSQDLSGDFVCCVLCFFFFPFFFFFYRPFTARQTGQLHICKKLKYVVKRLREITHQFVLICILRGLIYIAHSPFSGCGDNRSCYHYDSLVMLRPKRTEASKEEEEDEEDDEEDDEEEEAAATAVED